MKRAVICLLVALLSLLPVATTAHEAESFGNVYCRSAVSTKRIALTFDDGPHPRYTKEILKILAEYKIPATFFIIGVNAERYPEDLQAIVDAGCELGNHTYSHPHMRRMDTEATRQELLHCQSVIQQLTGIRPTLFRPPEGIFSENLYGLTKEMQYQIVLWSIDTKDWAMNPSDAITQTVMSQLRGGDIILMHDYVSGGNTTCDALRAIIPQILSQGYSFVTVSELIKGDCA